MHTDNRYDVWKCAKCGGIRILPSLPHQSARCCGDTMRWQELRIGKTYEWEDEELDGTDEADEILEEVDPAQTSMLDEDEWLPPPRGGI